MAADKGAGLFGMAFFEDLSLHTYTPTAGLDIRNIGWLDENRPFEKGPSPKEFRWALKDLCKHPIIKHRGFHQCCYCSRMSNDYAIRSGNGQIRVMGDNGIWYAAPTMIYHYVARHKYLPPPGFVYAVISPVALGTNYGWWGWETEK